MKPAEQAKIQAELIAARDRQAVRRRRPKRAPPNDADQSTAGVT